MRESHEFIAEKPRVLDNELATYGPSLSDFEELARQSIAEAGETDPDEAEWFFQNQVFNKRGDYFRMRYRGATWPWSKFHPGEALSENQDEQINQFLAKGYWAPAVDLALHRYDETGSNDFKTVAVFAGGLHTYDALNYSWGFVDPKLKNDAGLRLKHFLIFAFRLSDIAKLPMDETEQNYFMPLKQSFDMALAEIAAQSPASFCSYISTMDSRVKETGRGFYLDQARSTLLDLSYLDSEHKIKVVDRYKRAAITNWHPESTEPYFLMNVLQLAGLATHSTFYEQDEEIELPWWQLTADEIIRGDITRLEATPLQPQESFEQDSLF